MRHVNASCQNKVVGVEENVVVAARAIGTCCISNEGNFCLVDGFACVGETIVVVVVSTGSIFVVIAPLTKKYSGIRVASLGEVHID